MTAQDICVVDIPAVILLEKEAELLEDSKRFSHIFENERSEFEKMGNLY
jgi:hypothetical protein